MVCRPPACLDGGFLTLDVHSPILLHDIELGKWIEGRCILYITSGHVEASCKQCV